MSEDELLEAYAEYLGDDAQELTASEALEEMYSDRGFQEYAQENLDV